MFIADDSTRTLMVNYPSLTNLFKRVTVFFFSGPDAGPYRERLLAIISHCLAENMKKIVKSERIEIRSALA